MVVARWPEVSARRRMAATEAGLAAVSAAIAVLVVQGVATVNYVKYGVHEVVEFKQREFLDAYGALSTALRGNPVLVAAEQRRGAD